MSDKRKLLIQIDSDPQPSLFDRIVAFDSGAEEVLSHGDVQVEQVRELIHGCIFTRGPKDLAHTAVFIGGRDAQVGEMLFAEAQRHLLRKHGLSVSLMLDPNGANTTAAAAVRSIARHLSLGGISAGVIGAGPVGARVALMLAHHGATVHLVDVQASRAESVRQKLRERLPQAQIHTATELNEEEFGGLKVIVAAGPTGKRVLDEATWSQASELAVVIDLNAVPPTGVEGMAVTDVGELRHGKRCYGPLGIGGQKMKIHKAAIAQLFTRNDLVLDAEAISALAETLP